MKRFDPLWLASRAGISEERANRFFERSAAVSKDEVTTWIRCGSPRFASLFVAGAVLFVLLSVLGLTGSRWLLLTVVVVVATTAIFSLRESVNVTSSELVIRAGLRPFRKTITIANSSVEAVRVEAFRDSPWDQHVAIVTAGRTFRIATSVSEKAAQEIAQAIRSRIPSI